MSNVTTGNPIILDTANTSTVVYTRGLRVKAIKWENGTSGAADDHCVLKDQNGAVKYEAFLSAKDKADFVPFEPPLFFDGLICHTLDHGKVYLYLDGRS